MTSHGALFLLAAPGYGSQADVPRSRRYTRRPLSRPQKKETLMLKDHPRVIAEKYIQDQLGIMKKYGSAPDLDEEAYQKLLSETQRTFEVLSPQKKKSH